MTKREAKEKYFNLIKECYYREKPEGYTELHHICPKCLNLLSEEQNKLVALTYQEHLLAHYYLAVWFETEGLLTAFLLMAGNKQHYSEAEVLGQLPELEHLRQQYISNLKQLWQDREYREHQTEKRRENGKNPEIRQKISEATKHNWESAEYREKLKKVKERPDYIEQMRANKLKHWEDPEYQQFMSENSKKQWEDPEYREKCCKAFGKPVLQFSLDGQFIKEWYGARHASRELSITQQNISKVCQGQRKSAGGFVWKYKDSNTNK